jgi:hypothetical protein
MNTFSYRFLTFLLFGFFATTSLVAGASAFMNGSNLSDEQRATLQDARDAGDFEALQELSDQYGFNGRGMGQRHKRMKNDCLSGLTEEQKDTLQQAREAGDSEALRALHEEYGLEMGPKNMGRHGRNSFGKQAGKLGSRSYLEEIPLSELSDAEKQMLIEGQQEERLAQDTYGYLAELYDERVFSNISRSETQHLKSIGALLDRYGIDQTEGYGPYTDLYNQLTAKGELSLQDALEVGITIEITDIDDLDEMIALTDNEDIKMVYENLRQASIKHLRAFTRVLEMNDMETEIEWESYLEDTEYQGHWSSKRGQRDGKTEKGMRRGNGNG